MSGEFVVSASFVNLRFYRSGESAYVCQGLLSF